MLQMLLIVFGLFPIFFIGTTETSVLIADMTMSRMVELNAEAPFCTLYSDRGVIQQMVLGRDPKKVRQMSSKLVADLEETCRRSFNQKTVKGNKEYYSHNLYCSKNNLNIAKLRKFVWRKAEKSSKFKF